MAIAGPFRFVFLADTQLGCYATFSGFDEARIAAYAEIGMKVAPAPPVRGLEWDARQYRKAVAVVNELRPAFVVIGGDLIEDANSDAQAEEFLAITATVDPDIPVRFVPGNHDVAPDVLAPTPESIARYRAVFGDDLYSFEHGGWLFVVMNTTVIDHPEHVPNHLEAQFDFLESELARARDPRIDGAVLLGHHPLFVKSVDEPDDYWNLPVVRRRRVLELARRFGVRIGFAGHWHRNALAYDGGFTQVTSGPVGYPLGNDPSGYRIVDVDGAAIDHHYHALDP